MPIARRRSSPPHERVVAFQFPSVSHRVKQYRRSAVIFQQGASCGEVMYLQQGSVKLPASVIMPEGTFAPMPPLEEQQNKPLRTQ